MRARYGKGEEERRGLGIYVCERRS